MYMDRFWGKVEPTGFCWNWTAGKDRHGYGNFTIRASGGVWTTARAHRYAYELLVGPIRDGLVLDHLCRNTSCVNPDHLEPVTQAANTLRGLRKSLVTECPRGHKYDEGNTYRSAGHRHCRTCRRDQKSRASRAGV